ncbi:MAG: hypothetical protein MI923_18830 [Phycisphaerales bacterium]|nr:hypothetical protein [Phycisphaerales bacterium]
MSPGRKAPAKHGFGMPDRGLGDAVVTIHRVSGDRTNKTCRVVALRLW